MQEKGSAKNGEVSDEFLLSKLTHTKFQEMHMPNRYKANDKLSSARKTDTRSKHGMVINTCLR